jgi:MYXO-CTERM domain-containing protein
MLKNQVRRGLATMALAGALAPSAVKAATAPPLVPIQGLLASSSGTAVSGTRSLRFSLYATESSGTAVYSETHASVSLQNGEFVAYLGAVTPLALALFRDHAELWLEIVVDGSEIINPRFRLATAPYAGLAEYCGDALTLGGSAASAFASATHTHAFSSLTGIPAGLADGDSDTLAGLTCADGEVAKRSGGGWACGSDADLLATLACTAGQVPLRGAPGWSCTALAAVATSGSYADLTGAPTGLLSGAGTAGRLPRYSGASTLVDSAVFQSGTNVGIGTTTPASPLQVNGNIAWGAAATSLLTDGAIELGDPAALSRPYVDFRYGGGASADYSVRLQNTADRELRIYANTFRVQQADPSTTDAPNIVMGNSSNSVVADVQGTFIGNGQLNRVTTAAAWWSVIGGGRSNTASEFATTISGGQMNTASGSLATVGGGERNTASGNTASIVGGVLNTASGLYSTVGGGTNNTAGPGQNSAVAGGTDNTASGIRAAVGGGFSNSASGHHAVVPGGSSNVAAGLLSFAAGNRAKANNQGCFVWGDSAAADVTCSVDNRWVARATGGVFFYTNTVLSSGVALGAGSGTWTSISDRNLKQDILAIDPEQVLAKLERIPIATWRYQTEESRALHMGPMAQDFHAAFGLGDSDRTIATVDADGVALAAIQGLARRQAAEISELRARLARLEQRAEPASAWQGSSMMGSGALAFGLLGIAYAFGRRRRQDAS